MENVNLKYYLSYMLLGKSSMQQMNKAFASIYTQLQETENGWYYLVNLCD